MKGLPGFWKASSFSLVFLFLSLTVFGLDISSYIDSCSLTGNGTYNCGAYNCGCFRFYDNTCMTSGGAFYYYKFSLTNGVNVTFNLSHTISARLSNLTVQPWDYSRVDLFSNPKNMEVFTCLNAVCTKVMSRYNIGANNPSTASSGCGTPYYVKNTNTSTTIFNNIKIHFDGLTQTQVPTTNPVMHIKEIEFIASSVTNLTLENNSYPTINVPNLKNVYCFNVSNPYVFLDLNITDPDSDPVYWFPFYNNEFGNYQVVDSFSSPGYKMLENGWAFDGSDCNYSTDHGYLELFASCDNTGMIKVLDNSLLNASLDLDFQVFTFLNTSNVYEVYNWHNEKVTGLKVDKYHNSTFDELLTRFYYWNGTAYKEYGYSAYAKFFDVTEYINDTFVRFCIAGLDENDVGCGTTRNEVLHGTTDNIPAKLFMQPTFNFQWTAYETPFVALDELRYRFSDIPFYEYEGENIFHYMEQDTQDYLTIYLTDLVHKPAFKEFDYALTSQGICGHQANLTEVNASISSVTDETRAYMEAIPNGRNIFNNVYFFGMLILFIFFLIATRSLAISLVITGALCLFVSFFLSGDFAQMISAGALVASGLAILITGGFL